MPEGLERYGWYTRMMLFYLQTLAQGMSVHDFEEIEALEPGKEVLVTLGIDFNDTTQGAKMDIMWGTESEPMRKQNVTIRAPVGELIRAVSMSEALFITEQGTLCYNTCFIASVLHWLSKIALISQFAIKKVDLLQTLLLIHPLLPILSPLHPSVHFSRSIPLNCLHRYLWRG